MTHRHTALSTLLAGVAALAFAACSGEPASEESAEAGGQASSQAPSERPAPSRLGEVAQAEAQSRARAAAAVNAARASGLRRTVPQSFLTPQIINTVALGGTPPRNLAISPDGARVTYLQGSESDPRQLDLWAMDVETGERSLLVSSLDLLGAPEELSEEEKNRRERAREYGRGIISYRWVDADTLLFPLGGDVYLYDLAAQAPRQVTATEGFESDVKLSTDRRRVAYVRDDELFVTDLDTGLERQLTAGATDTLRNAVASFVVQEELGRSTGFWLSPDGSRAAVTQIDESPIAIERRTDVGAGGELTTIEQRYPFAGTPNARVRLGFVSTARRSDPVWADLPGWDGEAADDIYLTRVAWAGEDAVYAGVLSRDHTTHTVYRVDAATGAAEEIYQETSPTWLNIRSPFMPVEEGLRWISERDGARRVYALRDGEEPEALTPEGLLVGDLLCARDDGTLFVSGWRDDPLQTHIWRIDPADTATVAATDTDTDADTDAPASAAPAPTATRISTGEGRWSASFSSDCSRWIGRFGSPAQPTQSAVYSASGVGKGASERLFWIDQNVLNADHPYAPYLENRTLPEYGTLQASDGSELHYELFLPPDLRAGERRPSITIVYGGPGVQRVHKGAGRRDFARMLAHHGFVVFRLDGRGSSNRGKAFEDHLHRAMARVEVEDQQTGAEWLAGQSFIDPDRMGVYGWSYGGYMTLHMLGQTNAYAAGVSGAPVTDWRLYDTAYTERYLGDPNPGAPNYTQGAYESADVMAHLDGLDEPVLVIHGMADDNVVFRHTVLFADGMVAAGKPNFAVVPYPGEKHGFRAEAARIHRDRTILGFFLDEFGAPEAAPEDVRGNVRRGAPN